MLDRVFERVLGPALEQVLALSGLELMGVLAGVAALLYLLLVGTVLTVLATVARHTPAPDRRHRARSVRRPVDRRHLSVAQSRGTVRRAA